MLVCAEGGGAGGMSRTHPMAYTKRADADSPWICDAITAADADRPRILRCKCGLSADAKCADPHTSDPNVPALWPGGLASYSLGRTINK